MGTDEIYLSIDFDAIDPAFAPGVGTPEPFGLSSWDVRYVVDRVAPKAVGLDANEIAPQYDGGQTASLGAKLIREFIAAKAAADRKSSIRVVSGSSPGVKGRGPVRTRGSG